MKPVDCHCHLDFEQYDEDREEVIQNSKKKLEFVVNAGANLERNRAALELQEENPDFIVANLGLHPTFTDNFDELERIKQQIREEDPAAIGEIGLDYHHVTEEDMRERQEEIFIEFLELAEELGKPVVVHSRDAEKRAVELLKDYSLPGVMLHCFNGTPELAAEAAENGMFIGATTQILYSNRVQNIAEKVGLESLLLETDGPFLYPNGRNEPVHVLESAEKIAEVKDVGTEQVVERTTSNARELFL